MKTGKQITLHGCHQHNLRGFDISFYHNVFTAITGVSGSGKTSLAFDLLFAEGQRRYLEHLSPDLRRLAAQLPKPHVDAVEGLSPTVAVSQHSRGHHYLATVATATGLYDYLAILYARLGEQYSPHHSDVLQRHSRAEVADVILRRFSEGSRLQLLAPIDIDESPIKETVEELLRRGFIRARRGDVNFDLDSKEIPSKGALHVVVDRLQVDPTVRERLASSIETAMELSRGVILVQEGRDGPIHTFSEMYLCPISGERYEPLTPRDFSFRSPRGACPECGGKGKQDNVLCTICGGGRLRPQSLLCRVQGRGIHEIHSQRVEAAEQLLNSWDFSGPHREIAQELLQPVLSRLRFLQEAGLHYLELDREMSSLSAGEYQRVLLTGLLGTGLSGLIYVLDEPSLGLHPSNTRQLAELLSQLVSHSNTVLVVEHDRQMIEAADEVVEIGPGAGRLGGEIVFQGSAAQLRSEGITATGSWLAGKMELGNAKKRSSRTGTLQVVNATLHNLDKLSVEIPLGMFVAICGVSGSGKSSLASDIVGAQLRKHLYDGSDTPNLRDSEEIVRLVESTQSTAGRSTRSIPATYVGIMSPLRKLFSQTRLAQARGYTAARFSLNKKGGRCDACDGKGYISMSLELIPDIDIPCELCQGARYNYETLQVAWRGYSIADVLNMTASEALGFFADHPQIARPLELLVELGLDYLTLGQHAHTLSGGELQRLKLVADLAKPSSQHTLYLLDEPSSGLHAADIAKLERILQQLVNAGHSVVIVEHRIELLQCADWVIELGPEGGPGGGNVIFQGTIKQMLKANTPTSPFLESVT